MSYQKNNMMGIINFLNHEDQQVVRQTFLNESLTYLHLLDDGSYVTASYDPGDGVYIELPQLTREEKILLQQSPETDFRLFPFFARLEKSLWQAWDELPSELFDEEEDEEDEV